MVPVLASRGTARSEALHYVALVLEGPFRLEQGEGATFEGRLASDTFSPTGQVELTIEGAVDEHRVTVDISEDGTFEYHHPSFGSTGQHTLTGRFAGGEFVEPASAEFAFEVLASTVMTLDGPAITRDGEEFQVTGALHQSDGRPIPNAAVQVASGEPLSLVTDAEGRFTWNVRAGFDESSAHDPHESALSIEVVFEDTDQLASSRATLDVAVGLPRIVVEPLGPVARSSDAILRGTVLLGTYPVPGAELAVGPDVAFRSNDVGTFAHPYPVSKDEPLGDHRAGHCGASPRRQRYDAPRGQIRSQSHRDSGGPGTPWAHSIASGGSVGRHGSGDTAGGLAFEPGSGSRHGRVWDRVARAFSA